MDVIDYIELLFHDFCQNLYFADEITDQPDVLHWYMLHRTSLVYMDMIGLSCQLKVICVICYRPLCLLMTC